MFSQLFINNYSFQKYFRDYFSDKNTLLRTGAERVDWGRSLLYFNRRGVKSEKTDRVMSAQFQKPAALSAIDVAYREKIRRDM